MALFQRLGNDTTFSNLLIWLKRASKICVANDFWMVPKFSILPCICLSSDCYSLLRLLETWECYLFWDRVVKESSIYGPIPVFLTRILNVFIMQTFLLLHFIDNHNLCDTLSTIGIFKIAIYSRLFEQIWFCESQKLKIASWNQVLSALSKRCYKRSYNMR